MMLGLEIGSYQFSRLLILLCKLDALEGGGRQGKNVVSGQVVEERQGKAGLTSACGE